MKAEAEAKATSEAKAKMEAEIKAKAAAATASTSATGMIILPGLESLHGKVDILADITTKMVEAIGELHKKTLPSFKVPFLQTLLASHLLRNLP